MTGCAELKLDVKRRRSEQKSTACVENILKESKKRTSWQESGADADICEMIEEDIVGESEAPRLSP